MSNYTIQRLDGKPFSKKEKKDLIRDQIENFSETGLPIIVQTHENKKLYITLDHDAEEFGELAAEQYFAFLKDKELMNLFSEKRYNELKKKYSKNTEYLPPEDYLCHGFEGFNTEGCEDVEYTLF